MRFEVSAETYAAFREAERLIVEELGRRSDDDGLLLELARRILRGPDDAGRSGYQVAMTICAHCEQGWIDGSGDPVAVGPEVLEMASCDAVNIGWAGDSRTQQPGIETFEGAAPEEVDSENTERIGAEECSRAHGAAHVGTELGAAHVGAEHGTAHVGSNHGAAHVGSNRGTAHVGSSERRARQEIPPSVRRAVFRRDRGQCIVPGCRCSVFLDAHHIDPLCEGGSNDPDNLCLLCGNHHRAVHRGLLFIEGRSSTGLRVRHADGTIYGGAISFHEADLKTKAFQGLRRLGMKESEVRRALSHAHVGPETTLQELLKQALSMHRNGGRPVPAPTRG